MFRSVVGVVCALVAVLVITGSEPLVAAPKPKTVTVDCTKGKSINKALESQADVLIVEIKGMCHEDVRVLRDDVTRRGSDPGLDGIVGVAPPPAPDDNTNAVDFIYGPLDIRGQRIVVENLTLSNGAQHGLIAFTSHQLNVRNCRFNNNALSGLTVGGAAFAQVSDSSATGNATGFSAGSYGNLILLNVVSTGNTTAVASFKNGRLHIQDSELAGQDGVNAGGGSNLTIINTTIDATGRALVTTGGVNAVLSLVELTGRLQVRSNSKVELFGVTQTATTGTNAVAIDSTVLMSEDEDEESNIVPTTLLGPVNVSLFGKVAITDTGSSITGDLVCGSGADAFCADPDSITGAITGCTHCDDTP